MSGAQRAREAGSDALSVLRRRLAEKSADLLRANPERMATAVEVGLVDREWLAEPGERPVSTTAPLEVIQRFLERSVEQEPSMIGQMGLGALQMMSWHRDADEGDTRAPQPLTIVFTDLEGFTAFTAAEGDTAALELLGEHHRNAGPVIRSRGGRIVKRIGDGLLLAFGAAEGAVLASLELQESLAVPLRLRVGLHSGEAVVTPGDVIGHDVNVAARVTDAASGGDVFATDAVAREVGDLAGVVFDAPTTRRFKGLGDDMRVSRVRRA